MAITLNGTTNTISGLAVGGLPDGIVDEDMLAATAVSPLKRKGAGTVLQVVEASANTSTYSTSTSYVETVITGAITPLKSDSVILVDVSVPIWPPQNSYMHIQLRSSGGNTNNDIGTWGNNYMNEGYGCFNVWLPYRHTSHSTTSAITYKVFCRKQSGSGSNWYCPNNNTGNSTVSWAIRMTEVLA